MIFSKASLQVIGISKKDLNVPMLDCIRLEKNGTVVGVAKNVIVAVEGLSEKIVHNVPLSSEGGSGCTISAETIKHILSSIKDVAFGGILEYVNVKVEGNKVAFEYRDGKRSSAVTASSYPGKWVKWKEMFKSAFMKKQEVKVILNRSRLKMLLDLLDKTAPDNGGESAVYLEFTTDNNLVLRAKNYVTGQWTYAVMTSYKMGLDIWPQETEFERDIKKSGKVLREHSKGD
jgi:hypothetical protein